MHNRVIIFKLHDLSYAEILHPFWLNKISRRHNLNYVIKLLLQMNYPEKFCDNFVESLKKHLPKNGNLLTFTLNISIHITSNISDFLTILSN